MYSENNEVGCALRNKHKFEYYAKFQRNLRDQSLIGDLYKAYKAGSARVVRLDQIIAPNNHEIRPARQELDESDAFQGIDQVNETRIGMNKNRRTSTHRASQEGSKRVRKFRIIRGQITMRPQLRPDTHNNKL